MREEENKLKARKLEAEHVLLGLGLIFLSYIIFGYLNIWFLDGDTYRKVMLAFDLPMLAIFCSWFINPMPWFVGLMALIAFFLPPVFSDGLYTVVNFILEGGLVLCFIRLTVRIKKGLQWWDVPDR